ncbi:MAG TPA: SDR family oxidoreductase [Anaeromyxobacter sp.]|nr:SDR family oxidoreductase [Anaeromyxobacter sp.]
MNDPVFLVTGAASGLGQSLASRLVGLGRRVVAADLDNHRLEEASRLAAWPATRVRLVPLDVREPSQWAQAFSAGARAFGGVDVLLHAAGHLKAGAACAATPEDVHRHLDVNAKGTAFGLQAAAAHMLPRGHGHAVVFSTLDAFAPRPGLGLHGAAAAAARSVALAADLELRPRGVAVTVVCTATVEAPDDVLGLGAEACAAAGGAEISAEAVVDAVLARALPARPRQLLVPPAQGLMGALAAWSPSVAAYLWSRRERRAAARGPARVRAHHA